MPVQRETTLSCHFPLVNLQRASTLRLEELAPLHRGESAERVPTDPGRVPTDPGRVMGIDFGRRRIGIAVSDVTATLASPLTTLKRRAGKRPPLGRLLELADRHQVRLVVVGLPLGPDGRENDWTDEVRDFGRRMGDRSSLPVEFHDERYSSVEAVARLRSVGLPKAKREDKARIDAAAATVILQDWLDAAR